MLDTLFMTVLDMTVKGSLVILAVMAARLLLRRAPKVISYGLWLVVLIRLLCPLELPSPVSILPEVTPVSQDYALEDVPVSIVSVGAAAVEIVGNAIAGENTQLQIYAVTPEITPGVSSDISPEIQHISVAPKDIWIRLGVYLWAAGVAVMAVYSVVSLLRLKRKLREAILLEKGVYETDTIQSPFVIGLFAPKIYLPVGLGAQEREYILAHEHHHIRRFDPVWKALGFFALCIHWFNPLVWLAFFLGCRDMEMSCDEAVLKRLGAQIRPAYAASLLKISTGKAIVGGTPLAFGEGDTKGRIRNLAKWKKPVLWISVVAVVLCAALAVVLLTDPIRQNEEVEGRTYLFGMLEELTNEELKLDVQGEEMVIAVNTDATVDAQPGMFVKVCCGWDTVRNQYSISSVTKAESISCADIYEAAELFVLQVNGQKTMMDDTASFVSFRQIHREEKGSTVTLYGMALHQTCANRNGSLKEISGSHIPVVLTFHMDAEGNYFPVEYWMPRDGSYYASDLRLRFPGGQIPDTQRYIDEQHHECMEKAHTFFEANMAEDQEATKPSDDETTPFEKQAQNYNQQDAVREGMLVQVDEYEYINTKVWNDFLRAVEAREHARMQVIKFQQGEFVSVKDILFDGQSFLLREPQYYQSGSMGEIVETHFNCFTCYWGPLTDKNGNISGIYYQYGLEERNYSTNSSMVPKWDYKYDSVDACLVFQRREEYIAHPNLPENLIGAKLMHEDVTLGAITDSYLLDRLENMLRASELNPWGCFEYIHKGRKTVLFKYTEPDFYMLLQFSDGTELRTPMSYNIDAITIDGWGYDYGPGQRPYEDGFVPKNGLLDMFRLFGLEDWPEEYIDWCWANGKEPPSHSLKVIVGEEPHH